MKKVLVAVDSPKVSKGIMSVFHDLVSEPENVVLLHVQQLEGNSMMTAMLGDAEMETLKESLKGTEHKELLDRNTERILSFYKKEMEQRGMTGVTTLVRQGHPSEEILKAAEQEGVDLIVVACSGKSRLQRFMTGCASREVEKNAKVPVLIAKGEGCGEHAHMWDRRETAYVVR